MSKKILIIVNSPPYGTVFPAEALRAGIAFAGMDHNTQLLFMGDGVYTLLKDQNPNIIEASSIKEGLANASEFGLKIMVDNASLNFRNIQTQEIEQAAILSDEEIANTIRAVDVIINF